MTRCPNGTRRNKKTGDCEPIAATKKTSTKKASPKKNSTTRRCPKGTRRNKKTGECESKVKVTNAPEPTYAHHVKCTIRYSGNFASEKKLSEWFESGDSHLYIHPDPEDDEVFNFKYRAEIVKGRYGYKSNLIHVEFDTNRDQEHIMQQILAPMEYNDSDGNYPVKGELVTGDIVSDSIYISNTEQYS